jgi:hypothetical protein
MPALLRLLALAAVVLVAPPDAAAVRRARCKHACGAAVTECISTSPYRRRKARRVCRRRLYRSCQRFGLGACDLAPPTTTTTLPPPVFSTTTLAPTTTTTTLVPVRSYTGTWRFAGTLATDTCGSSFGLADTFTIAQIGTSMSSTVGSVPGLVLRGNVTPDGFELVGSYLDSGCSVTIGLVASNDGTIVLSAASGFDITCPTVSCRSIWVGTLRR